MDDFECEIKNEFISEALLNLEESESSFMELEGASDPKPLLDKIFRLAHNLKGGSRAVGFGDVAEFTHQLENLVLKIQQGEVQLTSDVVTTLLKANDRLVEMLTGLKKDLTLSFNNADLLNEIAGWLTGQRVGAETGSLSENVVMATLPSGAEPKAALERVPSAEKKHTSEDEIVRVNLSKIDLLNDYVGEMIVLQSVIHQQEISHDYERLQMSIQQMAKLSKEIQNISMSLRMLPVKPLVQKLQRVVRDTAKALSKEVRLELTGEQLDIDKSVLDRLADPLIHILRNAVDHGIEGAEDRRKIGKSPSGVISLSFSNEGNHLVVEVKDDGKGIDGEILRKKAVERGLIPAGAVLSEKQLVHLIFHPGFSTKTEASEISGRGVGMDVVKTNVEKIGGQIDIATEVGRGSCFRLMIPLSLAVIEGLVVAAHSGRYVVPLSQVRETINLGSRKVHADKTGIGKCFELRGEIVPIISLDAALGLKNRKKGEAASNQEDDTVLIVNVRDKLMGMAVSDIVKAQQIVVKPLGNGIRQQRGWVGCCVLGDGLPTLIVSPIDLLDGKIKVATVDTEIRRSA